MRHPVGDGETLLNFLTVRSKESYYSSRTKHDVVVFWLSVCTRFGIVLWLFTK